ncbi:MAG: hypothetical protein Kow00124_15820 [Anaerolineae bacterium]
MVGNFVNFILQMGAQLTPAGERVVRNLTASLVNSGVPQKVAEAIVAHIPDVAGLVADAVAPVIVDIAKEAGPVVADLGRGAVQVGKNAAAAASPVLLAAGSKVGELGGRAIEQLTDAELAHIGHEMLVRVGDDTAAKIREMGLSAVELGRMAVASAKELMK